MATTTTIQGVNSLKGPHSGGDLHAYEICVLVDGTYATAAKPNFDVLAALQNQHEGVSAVAVKAATLFQDYKSSDGTITYTAANAVTAIAGSVVTFTVESGATDGATGVEVADGTALHGLFSFVVTLGITGA